jgi:hypothetical protein
MLMSKQSQSEKERLQGLAMMKAEAIECCDYFIDEFVYIESKGGDSPVTKFSLWPLQKATLLQMLTLRFLIFLKARQLGGTWLVLAYTLWRMLRPGITAIALSKTEIDANKLVQRVELILRHLPSWFITRSPAPLKETWSWDSTATWIKIRHPGSEDSTFTSLPAAQNSGASLTADILIMDECALMEWAEQIYRAAFPTINRPGDKPENGQTFIISTMRIGSFFHKLVLKARAGLNSYKVIFWPWNTDPSRDQAWYEETARNYEGNMHSDYPATIEEALSQAEGCFFQELDAEVHIKPPMERIPDYYQRFASIDYGLDGVAVLWFYIDHRGMIRVYREYYDKDKIITESGARIIALNGDDVLSGFYAPPDLWNRRQDTGKSFAESYAEMDIYLTKSDNRREQGWVAVKELLKPVTIRNEQTGEEEHTAKLTFDAGACPQLWRCLTSIQRDPKNYNDVLDRTPEDHELTHLPDALRYFAAGRTFPSVPPMMGNKNTFGFRKNDDEGEYISW